MFFRPSNQYSQNQAFGLVELMVSISIMTLVTTVVLVRQSAFDGAVLLRNQAYEVAFTIRQAQQLAVTGGDATRRYGVYFTETAAGNQVYILFADGNSNGVVDTNEQIGQTGRLDNRFIIRDTWTGTTEANPLSVIFERPNFDAVTCANNCYIDIARVGRTGTDVGTVRRVEVTPAGQISVVTY